MDAVIALATPVGRSALAVLRVTGADTLEVLQAVVVPRSGWPVPPGRARRVDFQDARGVFDDGVLTFHRGPRSATGDDLAELCCHGNPRVAQRLLDAAIQAGARLARAGEFTRRAVENGRMDLLEAEGVQQLIDARTDAGIQVARNALEGRLSEHLAHLREALLVAAAELEARLDYPDDDLTFEDDAQLEGRLERVRVSCGRLEESGRAGFRWVHGATVALVGAVNAGKSSLFNTLVGQRRALVHEQPGTTRDVVEAEAILGDLRVRILDTAGERVTEDPVEAAGLALARELVEDADLLLVVLRAKPARPDPVEEAILKRTAKRERIVVYNGVDRPHAPPPAGAWPTVAPTGQGVAELTETVRHALVGKPPKEAELMIASARQQDVLARIREHVEEALAALSGGGGPAVAAEEVTVALEAIDGLTGLDTREDILDAVFARFCIGK